LLFQLGAGILEKFLVRHHLSSYARLLKVGWLTIVSEVKIRENYRLVKFRSAMAAENLTFNPNLNEVG